ncbi:zinc-dependent alcohol dehydrogenase [Paenibacillus sp. GYB003]|uniref:zinc-dependent alcohol dehydrogenase n=1 Tax=Paenibacillus sp. GYB003 TaxID=2994392 RepID=UPI002F96C471
MKTNPTKMKTLQITNPEQAAIVEVPIPEPGQGQLLVKVAEVATCPQWDLHIYYGKPMFAGEKEVKFPYSPGQPGHEMAGVVEAAGPGCSLAPGQKVAAWRDAGHHVPGCYAEYVLMKEEHVLALRDELPFRKAVSLELAMCVAASVLKMKRYEGIRGRRCGVNGLGPAGLIAVQMLLAEGAREVVGLDPNPQRRETALRLGATLCCEPESELVGRRGTAGALELAIDCVGYPQAVRNIMDRTNVAVALFAVQRDDYALRHQGLSVIGYPGHYREAAEYALDLIVRGELDFAPLISRELPLERYAEGVELLKKQEAIKICFVPGMFSGPSIEPERPEGSS